jgi:hypothetical protein
MSFRTWNRLRRLLPRQSPSPLPLLLSRQPASFVLRLCLGWDTVSEPRCQPSTCLNAIRPPGHGRRFEDELDAGSPSLHLAQSQFSRLLQAR